MWHDPSTGKFFSNPAEFQRALREASPLLRKAILHPEQVTHEEAKQLQLEVISALSGLLPDEALKHLARKESDLTAGFGGPKQEEAAHHMLEGELALRELGLREQNRPELALFNPQTGQIMTESDAQALLKERRAQRAKKAKAKRAKEAKAKGTKPAKTKRGKSAKTKRKRKSE